MTDHLIKLKVLYGDVKIDRYKLPPLIYIAECPIGWTLAKGTTPEHRKYLAASIILGQKFA